MNVRKLLSLALALVLFTALLTVPAGAYGSMGKAGTYTTVCAGDFHAAAIDANGVLWMWGTNGSGQLGNGSKANSKFPIKVMDNVVSVSCGEANTAAITADGSLWTWGNDEWGRLGNGEGDACDIPVKVMDNVTAVSCGTKHTAAVKSDGTLWTWGWNEYGQLGADIKKNSEVPVKVLDNAVAVSCGPHHTAAIKTDGSLWTWGWNEYGQLGTGNSGRATAPVKVMDNAAAVSCGKDFTAAIKTDGSLWIWGRNNKGQLTDQVKYARNEASPCKIMDNVAAVSCGYWYTAALKTDGTLWTWGNDDYGTLGKGTKNGDTSTPTMMLDNVTAVHCGPEFAIAVRTDGTVWTWGRNNVAQLGYEGGNLRHHKGYYIQTLPRQVPGIVMTATTAPAVPMAYTATQSVNVDGKAVEFQCYALKDANGNPTNYIKLRDLAMLLNGTAAQFNVGWDGDVDIAAKTAYVPNGTELKTPYSGDRPYALASGATKVNGNAVQLSAFVLTDDAGGGYTYYKLRDLGWYLGFNVGWSADKGVYVETGKPYDPAN